MLSPPQSGHSFCLLSRFSGTEHLWNSAPLSLDNLLFILLRIKTDKADLSWGFSPHSTVSHSAQNSAPRFLHLPLCLSLHFYTPVLCASSHLLFHAPAQVLHSPRITPRLCVFIMEALSATSANPRFPHLSSALTSAHSALFCTPHTSACVGRLHSLHLGTSLGLPAPALTSSSLEARPLTPLHFSGASFSSPPLYSQEILCLLHATLEIASHTWVDLHLSSLQEEQPSPPSLHTALGSFFLTSPQASLHCTALTPLLISWRRRRLAAITSLKQICISGSGHLTLYLSLPHSFLGGNTGR